MLLEYAVEAANDSHVARVIGVESEIELAFAALQQLLAPLLPGLARRVADYWTRQPV